MASVYKCLDANNKVYFSDRQCDVQQKQEEIEIENDPAPASENKKK